MLPRRMFSKADLHVHSRYSDRPSEWFLRRIGAPECFTEPRDVYRRAKERGMDFVTISDHNNIEGALEIADLPGTFLSNEVTTYFPEDGCKVHCLVSGITEEQFRAIQGLRSSIYDFQRYCEEEGVICAVNHPLFRVNDRLTIDHVEKLLVLFKRFEAINGTRDARALALMNAVLSGLTPDVIASMADRHGLEPCGPKPWVKWLIGGSDDHSGVHVASAHTVTPKAESVEQFLDRLRSGDHRPAGASGGSLHLGHGLYHIAYSYYKERLLHTSDGRPNLIGPLLEKVLSDSLQQAGGGLSRFLPGFATRFVAARKMRSLSTIERTIAEEFGTLLDGDRRQGSEDSSADVGRTFATACRIGHTLAFRFLSKFARHAIDGRLVDSLQTLASLGPVLLGVAPYLAAFSTQHKDDPFLDAVAAHFPKCRRLLKSGGGKAWVTDTLTDVNGVCRTIDCLGREARKADKRLKVITCLPSPPATGMDLKNFTPLGTFPLPEYDLLELSFPPFLEVIEYLERERFDEIIISTPGPLGLVALGAARLLRIPVTCIYHTDFPLLVRHITQDDSMEQLTWKYMLWFYAQADSVLAPSPAYRELLVRNGFDGSKLAVLGHGVDLESFSPAKRDRQFWARRGLSGEFTFLYVGRVSAEKNLEILLRTFLKLVEGGRPWSLAIAGDGPHLAELRSRYRHPQVTFTGFLHGEELSAAYASADALIFPSTTDTFGMVVLEANACGLPAIVSDRGGPADIVRRHGSGLIVDMAAPGALAEAMQQLAQDPDLRARLGQAGLQTAAENTWPRIFQDFWTRRSAIDEDRMAQYRSPSSTTSPGLIEMEYA